MHQIQDPSHWAILALGMGAAEIAGGVAASHIADTFLIRSAAGLVAFPIPGTLIRRDSYIQGVVSGIPYVVSGPAGRALAASLVARLGAGSVAGMATDLGAGALAVTGTNVVLRSNDHGDIRQEFLLGLGMEAQGRMAGGMWQASLPLAVAFARNPRSQQALAFGALGGAALFMEHPRAVLEALSMVTPVLGMVFRGGRGSGRGAESSDHVLGLIQAKAGRGESPSPLLVIDLGRAFVREGKLGLAIDAFRWANQLGEHPRTWCEIGIVERLRGDLAGSESALRQAIRLDNRQGRSFCELGITLRERGKFREAEQMLEKGVSLNEEQSIFYPFAQLNLAILYRFNGNPQAALHVIQKVNDRLRTAGLNYGLSSFFEAWLQAERGETQEAQEILSRARVQGMDEIFNSLMDFIKRTSSPRVSEAEEVRRETLGSMRAILRGLSAHYAKALYQIFRGRIEGPFSGRPERD